MKGVTQYMSQELGEALVRYWFMSQIQKLLLELCMYM